MKILLTALAALVLAAPALAARPGERQPRGRAIPPDVSLDRSRHHRRRHPRAPRPAGLALRPIDGTVWYEIEAAPDGTIVATVQGAGQLAPVVRIYRRNPSNIEEVSARRRPAARS